MSSSGVTWSNSSCSQAYFADPVACNRVLAMPLGASLKGQDNSVFFSIFFFVKWRFVLQREHAINFLLCQVPVEAERSMACCIRGAWFIW